MSNQTEPAPLLKTCQTCFHAKIRCDKTQDSGLCDRCLRLGKTCIFAPSRRRNVDRSRLGARPRRLSKSPARSLGTTSGVSGNVSEGSLSPMISGLHLGPDGSIDPFQRGLLSPEKGQELLNAFNSKMAPYFPFIVFSESFPIHVLQQQKPHLCLAVLAAASHRDVKLQRSLGGLFNEVVGARLVRGSFATLDMLQGLLVHLAWAHYQPRPRRYSQHLLLAMSIVSDMRLDKARNTEFWGIGERETNLEWNLDEMRAFAGAYYLASNSSVLLQKSRHFNYTPYIFDCCQRVAAQAQFVTDKYLPYIIHLQKLTEEVDDIVTHAPETQSLQQVVDELHAVKERLAVTKSSLPFSLSESPTMLLQVHILEALISQSSPDGTPFGLSKFRNVSTAAPTRQHLLDWLSQSISSVRSLLSVVLILPHGEEGLISNIAWIILYCALSLAVRLDLLAAHPDIASTAQHLRQFLDMPHTLRQIVMRLEATASQDLDARGDRDAFFHLAKRARRLEEWYLERSKETATAGSQSIASMSGPSSSSPSSANRDTPLIASQIWESSHQVTDLSPLGEFSDAWLPNTAMEYGSEIGLGMHLFAGFQGFSETFQ